MHDVRVAPDSPLYCEIPTGGRWSPRQVAIGDRVGQSVVLRDLGVSINCRRFEITCHFCEHIQIRSTGQINDALRRNRPIVCPECLREGRLARAFVVQDKRLERVLDGGPMYTAFELDDICSDVLFDLEAEFGPSIENESIADLTIATGWPYSASAPKKDAAAEHIMASLEDRAWRREMNNAIFAKRDLEYRAALRRAYERQTEEMRAANREHQKLLRQVHEREQKEFMESARKAAEALESVIAAGGEIFEPLISEDDLVVIRDRQLSRKAPCPCGSRLTFSECHGSTDKDYL